MKSFNILANADIQPFVLYLITFCTCHETAGHLEKEDFNISFFHDD